MYRYRKGDKVFYKVLVGAGDIPIDEEEMPKAVRAMAAGDGIVFFKMGVTQASRILGIVPDRERSEDYNTSALSPKELPNLIIEALPPELQRQLQGTQKALKLIEPTYDQRGGD